MPTAYLGLGSNLGDRRAHLRAAVAGLDDAKAVRVTACSPVYETEAHTTDPSEEQPAFLNAVLEVAVECAPEELLRLAKRIERAEGRTGRSERWAPRPLDIDLLVVGEERRQSDTLTVPHPRLAERRFVLQPWADLAPVVRVPPPFDATVQELLAACTDSTEIRRVNAALDSAASSSPSDEPE
jgi:2-amino-4-hydroxy-6-hydroxymethyldihydropteridine diphosphokinase